MAVFAKTISNGFPMGAIIGTASTMEAAQKSFISSAYWTEGVGPAASVACIKKMKKNDIPSHLNTIGKYFQLKWKEIGKRYDLPVFSKGRPELVQIGFNHPEANSLMTLFTTRMLDEGFLATSGFNPTWAHQTRHVDDYFDKAENVFTELSESLEKKDINQKINNSPKHTGFSRLVN
jgi:glutamate-1-semialdehyde aminotransferase